jgi:nucleoporin NUP159
LETGNIKSIYGKPPSANNQSIISTTWLSASTFHTIYAPPGPLSPDVEQTHLILSVDKNKHTASDIKLTTPYFPSPGIRPPGSFTVVLRNWEPAKFILLIGDSASSDIGVIGSLSDESWYNFSLEETSTPSLPLDKDMNDTVLIALELDLTSTESYQHTATGEMSELPPPPIMYAYVSDGTLLGWYIVNSQGQAYNGMVSTNASVPIIIAPAMSTSLSQRDMHMSTAPVTPVSEPPSAFGQQTSSQSAFGQSAFCQPSFLQPQSAASAFGQSPAFGQSSQPSAFGQTSSNSSFAQTSSNFGSSNLSGGFGAFSSAGPARFGQTAFGFGTSSSPTQPTSPALTPPPPEDAMASDDGPSFEDMSLGGTSHSDSKQSPSFGSGIFGQAALARDSNDGKSISPFGSSGFGTIKPATGFGAFANLTAQQGAFGNTAAKGTSTSEPPKPASAFGKSGFEAKASGAFGQPAFGQSGFGQPSVFGKSGFGLTSIPTAQPTSGGFGAFSSGGPASFASAASHGGGSAPPVQPTGGGFAAFAQTGSSDFASAISSGGEDSEPAWASGGSQGVFGAVQSSSDVKSSFSNASMMEKATSPENTLGALAAGSVFTSSNSLVKDEARDVEILSTPKPTTTTITLASPPSPPESTAFHSVDNKSLFPFGQNENLTAPASSPFKSSAPASGTGAFGQLKTSPTGFFKPADGFGAFGSNINKDSPFFNPPKEVGTKATLAFGPSSGSFTSINTHPKSGSTTPAIRSFSVLGSSKPAFGSTSTLGSVTKSFFGSSLTPAPAISEPTSGGFSAFSDKSAFGSLVGAKTSSFGDLLRGGAGPSKPTQSVSVAAAKDDAKPFGSISLSQEKPKTSWSVFSEGDEKEPDVFASETSMQEKSTPSSAPAKFEGATSAQPASARTISVPDETDPWQAKSEESKTSGKDKDSGEIPQGSSLSQSSSFVEISAPSDDDNNADIPDRPTDSGSDLEDDTRSFLSESFSSDDSPDGELTDEEAGSDEGEGRSRSPSPEHIPDAVDLPLPLTPQAQTRSPSTTPKPETLGKTKLLPPPPFLSVPVTEKTPARSTGGGSTTPPGSPQQEASSMALLEAPVSLTAAQAPTFGLGLARPSTRPSRSSPLASAAPLAPGVDGAHTTRSGSSVIARPASPKLPFGVLGTGQTRRYPHEDDATSRSKRPKTPPLLSGFFGEYPPPSDDVTRQPAERSSLTLMPLPPSSAETQKQTITATAAIQTPSVELQGHGMQTQCAFLYIHLTKELDAVSYISLDDEH